MTLNEKIGYKLFVKTKGISMGSKYSGFKRLYRQEKVRRGNWKHLKDSMSWEYSELYYQVYSPEDTIRHVSPAQPATSQD